MIEGRDEYGGAVKLRVLREVAYLIEAHFDMTPLAAADEEHGQHAARFKRAMSQRRFYRPPFLGLKTYHAQIAQIESDEPLPASQFTQLGTVNLGILAHDIGDDERLRFFDANLTDGILDVPPHGSAQLFS